jgi:L-amino acid N-acyltransferase YncA
LTSFFFQGDHQIMKLNPVIYQPANPERHFAAIARLISGEEGEPTTEKSLLDWYRRQLEAGIWFTVVTTPDEQVLGFNGLYHMTSERERLYGIYVIVDEPYRECGLGSLLLDKLLHQAEEAGARTLVAWVRDAFEAGIQFATRAGFERKTHSIAMAFNLLEWDEARYAPLIQLLQQQGFHFTSMAELGDTPEARRKLYQLNNSAAADDPGSHGVAVCATFEDFDRSVCQAAWYRPDGQIIAIDEHSGDWAAMSAITVFDGADHAYNLFTGTDGRYRGRKLAQAVKSLALRRARSYGVDKVTTSHTSENAAMIAIDTKLGYVRTRGVLTMEKELAHG